MKNQLIISCVIVAVIFGAGGFYGGMQYANSQRGARGAGGAGQFATFQRGAGGNVQFRGGNGAFGGGASGEVLSKDDKSLTLKLADGGSKVVYLSASTTVSKMASGSLDDVTQGTNVMVIGSSNSDGSVTAQMIQLRPARPMNATSTN